MVRLAAVRKSVTAPQAAQIFVDDVFRHHGLPEAFVSDRDLRFVSHFWQHLFRLLDTRLDMSTADHPQTDGQTEQVNRVLEDTLPSVCAAEPIKWSTLLQQAGFALYNAVHSSTGFTPFYVNGLRHPRTLLTLPPASNLGGGEANAEEPRGLKGLRTSVMRNLLSFIETGEAVRQRVRDAIAAAQDRQKENSDRSLIKCQKPAYCCGVRGRQHEAASSLHRSVYGYWGPWPCLHSGFAIRYGHASDVLRWAA
ncbi:unnamed protein product [Phytophthora fragariaefolia]|uniref:Unnamed protein product n=1 Tax=Phytophthora fragariaefolia TaxID=1490495 RepID=A0A9W6TUN3_9STRA|nr:unnamed protein product [Phytophthora fragariaefolia]